jgi:hypothetical protein
VRDQKGNKTWLYTSIATEEPQGLPTAALREARQYFLAGDVKRRYLGGWDAIWSTPVGRQRGVCRRLAWVGSRRHGLL